MWQTIAPSFHIPTDRDLQLAVQDGEVMHTLVFPCRRGGADWVDAHTGRLVNVRPTHWREWHVAQVGFEPARTD
jgi:hypothetical protein